MIFAELEWFEVFRDMMESRVQEIATCIPGRVTSYDPSTQRANVQPAVQRPIPTDVGGMTLEPFPELLGVPVAFPRAGNFCLHLPLVPNDFVMLVFPMLSISEFLRIGNQQQQVDPGDVRYHSLGSVYAMAGVYPDNNKVTGLPANEAVLGNPSGAGVAVGAAKVKAGHLAGPLKPAARQGDSVSVTFPPGTLNVTGPGGASTNTTPVTGTGQITSGSAIVDISD